MNHNVRKTKRSEMQRCGLSTSLMIGYRSASERHASVRFIKQWSG